MLYRGFRQGAGVDENALEIAVEEVHVSDTFESVRHVNLLNLPIQHLHLPIQHLIFGTCLFSPLYLCHKKKYRT